MKTIGKKLVIVLILFLAGGTMTSCHQQSSSVTNTMSTSQLLDKIKGGWAGQTIGVSFGSHTEFRYQGTFIQDYQSIPWHEGYVQELMDSWPDLYDDIYMDLTFVDVLERVGLDAPVDSFAIAFATADYNLWHANQAARYNILHGVKESGHWLFNPHADDIDYQIEADFAGLMNPGMPNSASEISDKIGHIMCYGDGWYGGVYVGAMYSLAFISNDIQYIVEEALKTIPIESTFYQCISDVIKWHKQYPDDWKQTWFELQKHYSEEVGCPDGVFVPLDIDAKINAAYIVLGLLYGNGDFTKTMEISTRAGQDSDCNPSSAGGILGVMLGYSQIPEYWMQGLKTIPIESTFYQCISDVIKWHKQYPDDWKQTWFELQKHYSEEVGCPDGVFVPLDIDAKINAAYIVLGLLYGNGDFTKTMEISTRAGQDSDCNPSSAGGILGVMLGYSQIPEYWMQGLRGAEAKKFKYTSLSLDDLYAISYRHALLMIEKNGGTVFDNQVMLPIQKPTAVRLEQCFEGVYPLVKKGLNCTDIDTLSFDIDGVGFVIRGEAIRRDYSQPDDIIKAKLYIDNHFVEEAEFPTSFRYRRLDLFWNYQLPNGKHNIKVVVDKQNVNALLRSWEYIVYSDKKQQSSY